MIVPLPPDDRAVMLTREFLADYPQQLDLRTKAVLVLAFRWQERRGWRYVALAWLGARVAGVRRWGQRRAAHSRP